MYGSTSEPTKRTLSQTSPEDSEKELKKRNSSTSRTMGSSLVGNMSIQELMEAIGTMMETKLVNIATKEDICILKKEVEAVRGECDALKEQVKALKEANMELKQKLDYNESREKKCNLIFRGLPETDHLTSDIIKTFCKESLRIEKELFIKNAFRLGKKVGARARPILVEFIMQEDVKVILDSKESVKNSSVLIHRDRTLGLRKKRIILMELKNEVIKINKNITVEIRGERLIVNRKVFLLTEDNKLVDQEGDAAGKLSLIIGADIHKVLAEVLEKISSQNRDRNQGYSGNTRNLNMA